MDWLGDGYSTSSGFTVVRVFFTTHSVDGGIIAPSSAFETADFRVYKDGSANQRSSQSGWTISSPFDTQTGLHLLEIDLTDNTDVGFYASGSEYTVVLDPDETVDGKDPFVVLARFRIGVPNVNVSTISNDAITASAIAANAIGSSEIADGAITAAKIATGAIDADAIAADAVTEIQSGLATSASIAALNDLSAAEVNAEVLDVLNVDTFAEIGQEGPAATQTIRKMLGYLYKAFRNKIEQDADELRLYNDDGTTVGQKATVSDDGSTFTRGEMGTGA